jgi:hypothetical protein
MDVVMNLIGKTTSRSSEASRRLLAPPGELDARSLLRLQRVSRRLLAPPRHHSVIHAYLLSSGSVG